MDGCRNPEAYQPMRLTQLAGGLRDPDDALRWRLVAEFLEEYRWEPIETRFSLLADEPDVPATS